MLCRIDTRRVEEDALWMRGDLSFGGVGCFFTWWLYIDVTFNGALMNLVELFLLMRYDRSVLEYECFAIME